ncbi:hypothetical protein TrLO_g9378 [Triparma laevis f. longispina]|uniref:Uncharacterized protein n=1 Tax=Triparma laevis f. longispina TaxID=1714387 RepID=A0A9W7FSX7_9STRA|nr:hypothetical protein TrLO_g9378 [Triparma laevis f. longispina]
MMNTECSQYFEGRVEDTEELWARIKKDKRHQVMESVKEAYSKGIETLEIRAPEKRGRRLGGSPFTE